MKHKTCMAICVAIAWLASGACTIYTISMATSTPNIAMQKTVAMQTNTLVAMQTAMQTPTPAPSARICTGLAAGRVNVRACGSTRCGVLTTLPQGEPVTVITERDDWYRVQYQDKLYGWIYGKYICGE